MTFDKACAAFRLLHLRPTQHVAVQGPTRVKVRLEHSSSDHSTTQCGRAGDFLALDYCSTTLCATV
jgi:hypothetical protein